MIVTYVDGKRERHDALDDEAFAAKLRQLASLSDEIVAIQATREVTPGDKPAGPYPNNRQGRRRWRREQRKGR